MYSHDSCPVVHWNNEGIRREASGCPYDFVGADAFAAQLDELAIALILNETMDVVVPDVVPHVLPLQVHRVGVLGQFEMSAWI